MKKSIIAALLVAGLAVMAGSALFAIEYFKLYVRYPFLRFSRFFTTSYEETGHGVNTPNVLWMAPFFSGGGYSSEALSFASGLLAADMHNKDVRFKIGQHGDSVSFEFLYGMNQSLLKQLIMTDTKHDFTKKYFYYYNILCVFILINYYDSKYISICHSEPGAWNFPPLYETSLCPPENDSIKNIY